MTSSPIKAEKPLVIAGPCSAESYELMDQVAEVLVELSQELGFDYVFKASFDKANRTSIGSNRGPGIAQGLEWFEKLKSKYNFNMLTDIHETTQVAEVAGVVDYLQIPAFLCRQTDLLVAALETGKKVNVKKGQFMAPEAMASTVGKAQSLGKKENLLLTERGASFGYGDLMVDMRGFKPMAETGVPVIFDITHSVQVPPSGKVTGTSGARREFAPLLARSATATGYLSGYFLEVHSNPNKAISDKEAQLSIEQAKLLLNQLIPLWRQSRDFASIDSQFPST